MLAETGAGRKKKGHSFRLIPPPFAKATGGSAPKTAPLTPASSPQNNPTETAPLTDPMKRINQRKTASKPLATRPKVEKATNVSLKSLFDEKQATEETTVEQASDVNAPGETHLPRDPYSQEEFAKAWNNFCAVVKREDNLSTYATLSVKVPHINPSHEIELAISNDYQIKGINEVREQLLTYIRKALNNHEITLTTHIVKAEAAQTKFYSDKDKYNALVEDYPELDKLRKALGLDVEF